MASSKGPVVLVELDRAGDLPLHEQIERSVRGGHPRPAGSPRGTRLPSTRGLAAELGVSRGVVSAAYDQLSAEGYLDTRQGAPVRVASAARPAAPRPAGALAAAGLLLRLQPRACPTSPASLARAGSARSGRRGARRRWPPSATGTRAARRSCARRWPTIWAACAAPRPTPSTSWCAPGFMQGLSLTCRWLRGHGVERIALEDPGWHSHRLIVEQAGLEVVPVPVDGDGIRVDVLERSGAGRRDRDARAPVPGGRRAEPRSARRAHRMGRARGEAGHRGRLRRGAALRPGRGRGAPGPRARARPADRLGEQAPGAGHAARLDAAPVVAGLAAHLGQGGRGRRVGGRRPARARRLHRPRRARPPPAAHAPALPAPPRGAARRARPPPARRRDRRAERPACSSWSCCPTRSTSPRSSPPPRTAVSASRACRCTGSTRAAAPACCSASPARPRRRSSRACACSPKR